MVQGGLVVGASGKGGGYKLVKKPEKYKIGEILELMEGTLAPVACLEERAKPCTRAAACRTLPLWKGLNQVVTEYLSRFTIQDLMKKETDGFDYVI